MPSYDSAHFSPPAPVARVTLQSPDNGGTVSEIRLLMDTGADITLLPRSAVEQLGISPVEQRYELMGFDGSKSFASAVVLDLVFLKRRFRGQYLLTDEENGIVGRDILNHVALILDGPNQQWIEYTGLYEV